MIEEVPEASPRARPERRGDGWGCTDRWHAGRLDTPQSVLHPVESSGECGEILRRLRAAHLQHGESTTSRSSVPHAGQPEPRQGDRCIAALHSAATCGRDFVIPESFRRLIHNLLKIRGVLGEKRPRKRSRPSATKRRRSAPLEARLATSVNPPTASLVAIASTSRANASSPARPSASDPRRIHPAPAKSSYLLHES